ncbi:multicopper oxidase domain-containing protein [Luteolibacter sp. AS25]|uniref:multicopper oxidase domain-containing protein n=1 Tax=Luteolibacter sp. AS25 TaxID=3135776 RepID=UPI00398B082D
MKIIILTLTFLTTFVSAKVVEYNLTIANQEVNITGKAVKGMTINGGIPGPVLRFTEGDTAVIHVTNEMTMPTSVHWHGLLLPNNMDGVPFVTYPPIKPGTTFTYRFPIRQTGTYWYHSHSGMQEQRGVFGSMVILPRERSHGEDRDHVVLLSDWTNKNPMEILRNLRRGSEFFGVEKRTAQSVLGAVKTGKLSEYFQREAMRMPAMDLADVAYDAFLVNGKPEETLNANPDETVRLRVIDGSASTFFHLSYAGGPMTIVSADGQAVEPLKMTKPILMGVAETYDVLVKVPENGAYEFRATAHDGSGHSSLWIGSGDRKPVADLPKPFVYDTMMGFNWKNAFALTPAGTMGMPDRDVDAGKFDKPGMNMGGMDMPMGEMDHGKTMKMHMAMEGMDHSGMKMDEMEMSEMDHSEMKKPKMDHSKMRGMKDMPSMPEMNKDKGVKHNPPVWYDFLLREDAAKSPMLATDSMMSEQRPFPPYKKLRAIKDTSFPSSAPRRDFRLTLDGDMNRYVWMINNKPIKPEDDIIIREGEVIRFIMINRTMMHHPMHLHGHFFRVINGQGKRSPLKHTVDVAPMTTTVIEFMADEPGDWFFHCHLLYHMMSGMARVVEYESFTVDAETEAVREEIYVENNPWFFYGFADVLSNETQGTITFSDPQNILMLNWEAGWDGVEGTEWETDLTYGRYFNRFTTVFAGVYAEGMNSTREDERLIAGIRYLLPGNFMSQAWIDDDGEARFALERELMITPRLGIFGEVEYDTMEDWSYQAGLSYILTQYVSATALWDTTYGVGAGFTLRF